MNRRVAVTIGNFDGVHLGHRALIRSARQSVGDDGSVIALSFDPHPATVLVPDRHIDRLSDFTRRTRWLLEAGASQVVALQPTCEMLNQSPEQFVTCLAEEYTPSVIVEGRDFRFGKGRQGTIDTLRQLGSMHGYAVVEVDTVEAVLSDHSVVRVSSTMVRWLLRHGRVRDAAKLMGRSYSVAGSVAPGERRGREIGIPTANLDVGDLMLPADGVYIGEAKLEDGSEYRAAISVGTKPHFAPASVRTCEAHLLDFDGPCGDYHWSMELFFHDWLRDQAAFADLDALIAQIKRDIGHARAWSPMLETVR